jgi:hypothetical protein
MAHAGALDLSLFDKDRLIAHSLSIQQGDGFLNLRFVVQFNITECRRHASYEVSDNPNRPRFDTARFDPVLQFTVGAVVGDINEKQLRHYCLWRARARDSSAELGGFGLPRTLFPDLPVLEGIDMTTSGASPRALLRVGIALVNHLNH